MGREFRFYTKRGAVRGYVPDNYDGKYTVIYVHGYGDTTDSAWKKHNLLKQFQASGLRALFLVVAAPSNNDQPVYNTDIPTLFHDVLENAGIRPPASAVAIGHSGAYRTLTRWVDYDHLKQIILLDALFGGASVFAKYVASGGRLTNVATDRTAAASAALAKKVKVEYQKTTETHMGIVANGQYIPTLLRRSVAGGVPGAFFLLSVAAEPLYLTWGTDGC